MLSIIIPVFNGEKTLGGLLDSIKRSSFRDYEVIAVDDCSTDKTPQIIKNYEVRSLRLGVRSGPALARNRGAEIAKAQILVFFDADIEVEADTLERIARRFEEDPGIKVLVGTYSERPLNKGFFPRFKALWFSSLFDGSGAYTDSLEGFCAAIDKCAFDSVGGFNPSFQNSSAEDYELGCRLKRSYALYFDSRIKVRHNFPGFWKNAGRFFRRTYDFVPLYLRQNSAIRGRTLSRDGLVSVYSLFSLLLFPAVFLDYYPAIVLFWVFFFGFLFLGRKFIGLAFSREGTFFGLAAVLTYYVNSIILGTAIILGIVRYLVTLK